MSVSVALEKSARAFCLKYACDFSFDTFESRVEEFTFLRPVVGWMDVYKMTFEKLYKNTLENLALGKIDDNLDAEAMLDDFEYTLIRPYVNEAKKDINHKPYVGMDRISRLEYLHRLTKEAPSNLVEMYAEKYKSGELTLEQMISAEVSQNADREQYIKIASCTKALDTVNQERSVLWRAMHPFKSRAERSRASFMKKMLVDMAGDEKLHGEIIAAAYENFDRYQMINANLEQSMIHAREEMSRKQKMDEVMRESLRIEGVEKEFERELSPRVEQNDVTVREKQI